MVDEAATAGSIKLSLFHIPSTDLFSNMKQLSNHQWQQSRESCINNRFQDINPIWVTAVVQLCRLGKTLTHYG